MRWTKTLASIALGGLSLLGLAQSAAGNTIYLNELVTSSVTVGGSTYTRFTYNVQLTNSAIGDVPWGTGLTFDRGAYVALLGFDGYVAPSGYTTAGKVSGSVAFVPNAGLGSTGLPFEDATAVAAVKNLANWDLGETGVGITLNNGTYSAPSVELMGVGIPVVYLHYNSSTKFASPAGSSLILGQLSVLSRYSAVDYNREDNVVSGDFEPGKKSGGKYLFDKSGYSVTSAETPMVPLPAAVWGGGLLLGILAVSRLRKTSAEL